MKLYKHVANTDVAIEILKSFYVPEKQVYKLRVRWWNIGRCHEPWCMGIEQRIVVDRQTMHRHWELYEYIPNK